MSWDDAYFFRPSLVPAHGDEGAEPAWSALLFLLGGIKPFPLSFDIRRRGNIVTQYVLFIVTNAAIIGPHNRKTGFFFAEVAHPFEVLEKAGIAVEFAIHRGWMDT
jgi:hypothetical protein